MPTESNQCANFTSVILVESRWMHTVKDWEYWQNIQVWIFLYTCMNDVCFFKPRTKSLILVAIKHCCIWWQVDSECVVYNGGSDEDSIRHRVRRAATEQGELHRGSRWGTVTQLAFFGVMYSLQNITKSTIFP